MLIGFILTCSGPPMGELDGDTELPYNLVEHSLEQVNTQISQLTGSSTGPPDWINLDPEDEKIIPSDSTQT